MRFNKQFTFTRDNNNKIKCEFFAVWCMMTTEQRTRYTRKHTNTEPGNSFQIFRHLCIFCHTSEDKYARYIDTDAHKFKTMRNTQPPREVITDINPTKFWVLHLFREMYQTK